MTTSPAYGELLGNNPVRQKVEVSAVLPQRFPQPVIFLVAQEIITIFIDTDGVEASKESPACSIRFERVNLRRWKLTATFEIMNASTMSADAELKQRLYSFLADCGSRKISVDMERTEE